MRSTEDNSNGNDEGKREGPNLTVTVSNKDTGQITTIQLKELYGKNHLRIKIEYTRTRVVAATVLAVLAAAVGTFFGTASWRFF